MEFQLNALYKHLITFLAIAIIDQTETIQVYRKFTEHTFDRLLLYTVLPAIEYQLN